MSKLDPRNFDHVVFPCPDLDTARERLTALGFNVAPDARHKFGSENACVFFKNGTFIEPLAIGHRETVEADIIKGNPFLSRDAAYRFRNGEDGFSMIVMGETDPKAARKSFQKLGYETGKMVTVRRPGVKVRLAFAMDERAPDCTFFMCERPDGPAKFDSKLTKHANGAKRISRVSLYEDVPSDFQYYLHAVTNQREVRSHSFGMDLKLPNTALSVLNDEGMQSYYGVDNVPEGRGLRAMAIDVQVKDLGKVSDILSKSGIGADEIGPRIVVPPAPGQGAVIAFTEQK